MNINTNKDYSTVLGVLLVLTVIGAGVYFNTQMVTKTYDFFGIASDSIKEKASDAKTKVQGAGKTQTNVVGSAGGNWRTESNAQFGYEIKYPDAATLSANKVRSLITVLDNTKTVSCNQNAEATGIEVLTDSGVKFKHNPLQPRGTEHVSTYTTVKDGLCYMAEFYFSNPEIKTLAPDAVLSVELADQILKTFKFK